MGIWDWDCESGLGLEIGNWDFGLACKDQKRFKNLPNEVEIQCETKVDDLSEHAINTLWHIDSGNSATKPANHPPDHPPNPKEQV